MENNAKDSMMKVRLLKIKKDDVFRLPLAKRNDIERIEKTFHLAMLSAVGIFVCEQIRTLIATVRSSNTIEGRGLYGITTDLTQNKKILELCNTLYARIDKFYIELPELLDRCSYHDGIKNNEDTWANLIDCTNDFFLDPLKSCSDAVKKSLKPFVKPLDGVAFYGFIRIIFLAMIYENLCDAFKKNFFFEEYKPFKRLDLVPIIREMMKLSNLKTKEGKLIFTYFNDEHKTISEIANKKYFMQHPVSDYEFINLNVGFNNEDCDRASFEFEQKVFYLKNIEKMRAAIGAKYIDLEKLFEMHYDAPCMECFEQYVIVNAVRLAEWKRVKEYIPLLREKAPMWRGKKTMPIAGFYINQDNKTVFKGVWRNVGEASRETGIKFLILADNVRRNNKEYYASYDHVFMTLDRFEKIIDNLIA